MKHVTILLFALFFVGLIIPNAFAESVPDWVKNTAGWWATDLISETEFVNAIEYLVKESIIQVNASQTSETSQSVPDWVKNTAGWWATDLISETEFVNAISYLIKDGIINVQKQLTPQIEIEKLFEKKVTLIPPSELKLDYNSYGFRDSEFEEPKPDNTFRIIAIGGSTTFGSGVEDEFTWPSQLQKKLDGLDSEKNIEVINAGIAGATSFQNYKQIKNKLTSFEPDLFIIFEGANDHICMTPAFSNKYTDWSEEKIKERCGEHPTEEHALIMAERYSEICALGKKIGFNVIVTIQPTNELEGKVLTTSELNELFKHPVLLAQISNNKILTKTILEKTDSCSAVVNLTRIFDDYDLPIYSDRVHTGNLGYEIIAENILDNVVPILVEKNILNEKPNNLEKIPKNKFEFGQDLKYSDFSGKNLENENFFGADLRGSNFDGSILTNADFRLANLENTNFTDAKIDNIKLRQNNLKNADFTNVDFYYVDLTNVDFQNTILKNSDLSFKNLTRTNLYKADLTGADLSASLMKSMYLRDTMLKDTDLTMANVNDATFGVGIAEYLSGTVLTNADLTWINLVGIDLSGQDLSGTNFYGSNLAGQDFTNNVYVYATTFAEANLSDSNFEGVDLTPKQWYTSIIKDKAHLIEDIASMSSAEVAELLFTGDYDELHSSTDCVYKENKRTCGYDSNALQIIDISVNLNDLEIKYVFLNLFHHSNLENANFKNATMWSAYLYGSNLTNADLSGADLTEAYLVNANLSGANLSGANLDGADLSGADLSGANLSGVIGSAIYNSGTILNCIGQPICLND